jgi:hypothetical protein
VRAKEEEGAAGPQPVGEHAAGIGVRRVRKSRAPRRDPRRRPKRPARAGIRADSGTRAPRRAVDEQTRRQGTNAALQAETAAKGH